MPRILIVEDMPLWAKMLTAHLKKLGISSHWVKNGLLAVEHIQQHGKDYKGIIMDLQMTFMGGLEATRQLRALGFKGPIIGFSSMSSKQDIATGLEAGMGGYLIKSMEQEVIARLLEKLGVVAKHA